MENARPVGHSQVTITELMIPAYANFGGKIHGGILLSLMDKAAYACATKHTGAYCVTVSVDGVDFLQPVEVGDLVALHATVHYVGRTSLVVGIKVVAENVKLALVKHTNTSYFTMVAKDDDNKPVEVPGLILESKKDLRNFVLAQFRRNSRSEYRKEFGQRQSAFNWDEALELVKDERCVVGFEELK